VKHEYDYLPGSGGKLKKIRMTPSFDIYSVTGALVGSIDHWEGKGYRHGVVYLIDQKYKPQALRVLKEKFPARTFEFVS